jgi:hypothetical protein
MIFLSGCSLEASPDTPKASRGVMDMTRWDLNKDQTIQMDGQWEFYWSKFVNDREFPEETPDMYIKVPSTWNEYSLDGKSLAGEGYATYRLHVKTGIPAETMLGLRLYPLSSAYRLFINERLVASNGNVSRNALEEVGEYRPQAVFFKAPAQEFDIIIQVSNFQYARGGFWYSMSMGSAEGILALHDKIMGKEIFLLGALLMISLFYLATFIMIRELKYSFYFACLCITMAIALDMMGQYILLRFLPSLSLKSVIFIWYTSTTWVVFFLILFVHELFKSKFSGFVMKLYLWICIVDQLLYTFTASIFYTRYAHISNYIEITGVLCTIIIVGIGIKKGKKDAWLNIISMVIVLISYVHDILYWTNMIQSSFGEIQYIGLFLFIFLQMVIQAKRIRMFYDHKTAAELSFLQAQIKPHFLYNALNTFVAISRYDMDQARELLINFSNYLRRSFDFKDLSQTVSLRNEIELTRAYVEIEKARFEERLEVSFEGGDDLEVKVPILMLQPIVENAVLHGVLPKQEGGHIAVIIKKEGRLLILSVKDNGVGMELRKKRSVLRLEFGKGVGLSNIDSRLRKLYGKGLQINSSPGMGTEVKWCIPINRWESEE